MVLIKEDIINEKLVIYDTQEEVLVQDFNHMIEQHNLILSYFQQESFDLLTEAEKGLLEFMFTVIYSSTERELSKPLLLTAESMEEEEEKNWDIFNKNSSKKFTQICDIFFENYPQEDLLAFVEDTTQQDMEDEELVTSVGREILFISCKSLIDTLDKNNG